MNEFALMTDRYELTMLQSFIADGTVNKRAVFEVFTRKLPTNRRYGVFAGLGRLLPMIEEFQFDADELNWLTEQGVIDEDTGHYLMNFRFTGTIEAYREGEIFFPNSPLMTVVGTLGECVILETLILSVLNHDSAIATTAARMVSSAEGRPLIEMGSRRTHEESAVAAARAAYIAGFASTSNLLAGMRHGIPTVGTAAHAFTLAHGSERAAFAAQIASHGTGTTLLVDTYNTEQGIRNAVFAAQDADQNHVGVGPGAIRIDSGDLAYEAEKARTLLDELGATKTRITVTSDLDEYVLKDLADAPIDGYGVGTRLVASQPMGMVYKLVAIQDSEFSEYRPVAKNAKGKKSIGGRKWASREYNRNGRVSAEVFTTNPLDSLPENNRLLQQVVMFDGKQKHNPTLDEIREFHNTVKAELPQGEQKVWSGNDFGPYLTAELMED